jgi:hypothetical protein
MHHHFLIFSLKYSNFPLVGLAPSLGNIVYRVKVTENKMTFVIIILSSRRFAEFLLGHDMN